MKIISLLAVIVEIVFSSPVSIARAANINLNNTPVQVCFSPDDACTDLIINTLDKAKSEILLQAYSFTSEEIASALVKAHKKGIQVEVVLDKSNRSAKNSAGNVTSQMGIPTYLDARHGIANNKVVIIDRETLITGSFNFTKAAEEKNAENFLIIKNKGLAGHYLNNWKKHREHSERYERK